MITQLLEEEYLDTEKRERNFQTYKVLLPLLFAVTGNRAHDWHMRVACDDAGSC